VVVTCFCFTLPLSMVVVVVSLITVPSGSVLVVVLVLVLVELVVTGAGAGGGTAVVVEEEQPGPKAAAAMIAEVMRKLLSFIIKDLLSMKLSSKTIRHESEFPIGILISTSRHTRWFAIPVGTHITVEMEFLVGTGLICQAKR
jgi:hypothetical protein